MAKNSDTLFKPEKARWLLEGGLETLDANERHLILVMAEVAEVEGRELSADEKAVVKRLRAEKEAYDSADTRKKVRTMVKRKRKKGTSPLKLPAKFRHLLRKTQE